MRQRGRLDGFDDERVAIWALVGIVHTPERVVQAVGVVFGGAGYTTDPCPRVRRNLANLATGTDRALVDEEVRRHRRFCA